MRDCVLRIFFGFVFFGMVTGLCRAEKIDRIVAIVNSDVITHDELDTFARMALLDGEADKEMKTPEEMYKYFLDRMVEDRLILQEAKKLQLKVDEKMIEDRIRDIRFRAGSERDFQQALSSQGISLAELREKLNNQLLIYMVVQREVRGRTQVSPKEVTEYYEANKERFMVPESVVVESIFIEDQALLKEVEQKLSQGESFTKLAQDYSKRNDLGKVARGHLKKDLENFVFSLEPGRPSKPFAIDNGYYIFLVKERLPASEMGLDEIKEKVVVLLESEKSERILKSWIEDLKDKAYISIRQ
ncbi:MAG: peptidyl-prolyl cis-trans isomerase [Candidatus Omnitrophica bacterium]|nr:peptidyl-prolyl cis-trans isomerase [Candidatus Omnitrophota bacterium]MDD5573948.1 peptidyl-prolyl cis-trans isomerase [Candidatus Omnitrophota bacterium]